LGVGLETRPEPGGLAGSAQKTPFLPVSCFSQRLLSRFRLRDVLAMNPAVISPKTLNPATPLAQPGETKMKRQTSILAICLLAGSLLASNINANDGLNALFNNPAANHNPSVAFTADDLKEFVESIPTSNLKALSERAYRFDVEYGDFVFPTLVSTNEAGSVIWTSFNLAAIPEKSTPEEYSPVLLQLLSKNGEYGDYFFSYSEDNRMITLHGCIQVRSKITVQNLTDHLITLGEVASESKNLWSPALWGQDNPRHIGKWHSASHEMDLVLSPANRFELTSAGQVTAGSYRIDGDQVSMKDDRGDTIQGSIRFENANKFSILANGNEIDFVRQ
jgi:hypothetical protein